MVQLALCCLLFAADPDLEQVFADPPPALSVKINAPTIGIVGDKIRFTLTETGPKTISRVWSVVPAGTVGLDAYENGAIADFATRFEGSYVFIVSISGADGSVAHTYHVMEYRKDVGQPVKQPDIANDAPKKPIAEETPAKLVKRWMKEIKSQTWLDDAANIASAARQTAGGMDSGQVPDGNPIALLQTACKLEMGEAALVPWKPFFKNLEKLFEQFQAKAMISSKGQKSAALKSLADTIEAGMK